MGIGLLCSAIGDVHYSLSRFGEQAGSTASLSDALWLAPYLAFYAGMGLLVRAGTRHFHASMWLDGIAVALAFAALSALALDVLLTDSRAQFVLLLSYPLADLMFTALVVGIWAARGWELNGFWAPLACAGVTNAVADTANLFMIATGTFREESPVNSLWSAAALFVAIAAWRDVRDLAPTRLDGGRLLVVPVAVALMSLTVLLGDLVTPVRPPTQILAAAAIGAVVVRTALTFKEVALLADARRAARTDELTGLANRRAFHQHLAAALDPPGHPPRAAVLMIDLDRFKAVNDTLGHHVGDRLLTLVGQRFSGRVRAADVVARLGGDEFAVLLHGADLPAARRAAVALHHQLDEPFSIESATLAGRRQHRGRGLSRPRRRRGRAPAVRRRRHVRLEGARRRRHRFRRGRAAARRPRAHRERHPRAPVARQPRRLVSAALPAPARPALAHGSRAWRRWCAGTTRSGDCSPRRSSSRRPSRPHCCPG